MKAKIILRSGLALALTMAGMSRVVHADHPAVDFGPSATGPVTTISASTLPKGTAAIGVKAEYVRSDRLSDQELKGRAGEHIHAHSTDYLLSASIGVGYGVTDDFTVGLSLPHLYRANLREGEHHHGHGGAVNSVLERGDSGGMGDLTVLGKYRFASNRHYQAALLFGLKAPTGETRETDREGERFETEHQPGSGSWDPLLGLALTKRLGQASLDMSLLYAIATNGAQATELGNRAQYSLGISYRIGGDMHHHHHDESSTAHAHGAWDLILELNGEWEGKQKVAGVTDAESGGNAVCLSPGVRFASSNGWSGVLSVGVPVVQNIRRSHPERDYRVIVGISRAL